MYENNPRNANFVDLPLSLALSQTGLHVSKSCSYLDGDVPSGIRGKGDTIFCPLNVFSCYLTSMSQFPSRFTLTFPLP